jgi:hypothetical protein
MENILGLENGVDVAHSIQTESIIKLVLGAMILVLFISAIKRIS